MEAGPGGRRSGATRALGESGTTLIELIVATGVFIVVVAAVLTVLEVMVRQQPRASQHGLRVQEGRAALERMTRELRQTYSVRSASSSSVDVLTYERQAAGQAAVQRHIFYDCSTGDCTRQEGPVNEELDPLVQSIFTGVTNGDIFSYSPSNVDPNYVRVKLTFDVKANSTDPQGPVTVTDGVEMRNVLVSEED